MSTHSYVQLRSRLLDEASTTALAETFKVLGDPTRVRILDALAHAEVPVCDLAEVLGLTQSAVSHQLRLLRGMRLVRSRRDGQHIYYTLDDQHIVRLFEQGLEHVQERTPLSVAADLRVRPGPTRRSVPIGRARRA
jgi:DNA-binding transcriptional ArsR family regulator